MWTKGKNGIFKNRYIYIHFGFVLSIDKPGGTFHYGLEKWNMILNLSSPDAGDTENKKVTDKKIIKCFKTNYRSLESV